jgi:hypothetical protein
MTATMDIYISSSSMDHRIISLPILASCKSAYDQLPPYNRIHASICIPIVFCNIWLALLSNRIHVFVLLSSTKRHKSFSNFLSIVGFFLFLLLLSLFKIDSDFDLSCNSFHMIYFIFSCIAILILLFFYGYSSSWNILSF